MLRRALRNHCANRFVPPRRCVCPTHCPTHAAPKAPDSVEDSHIRLSWKCRLRADSQWNAREGRAAFGSRSTNRTPLMSHGFSAISAFVPPTVPPTRSAANSAGESAGISVSVRDVWRRGATRSNAFRCQEQPANSRGEIRGFFVRIRGLCCRCVPFLYAAPESVTCNKCLFYGALLVGAPRFELGTPSPPDWCANRAALRSADSRLR
jgi:hypothetical protein